AARTLPSAPLQSRAGHRPGRPGALLTASGEVRGGRTTFAGELGRPGGDAAKRLETVPRPEPARRVPGRPAEVRRGGAAAPGGLPGVEGQAERPTQGGQD